jgi:hypothetical protein
MEKILHEKTLNHNKMKGTSSEKADLPRSKQRGNRKASILQTVLEKDEGNRSISDLSEPREDLPLKGIEVAIENCLFALPTKIIRIAGRSGKIKALNQLVPENGVI